MKGGVRNGRRGEEKEEGGGDEEEAGQMRQEAEPGWPASSQRLEGLSAWRYCVFTM